MAVVGAGPIGLSAITGARLFSPSLVIAIDLASSRLEAAKHFGADLVWAGTERFIIAVFRAKDDRFLGPFTIAQLTSVVLVLIGFALVARWRKGSSPAPGAYLLAGRQASATGSLTAT